MSSRTPFHYFLSFVNILQFSRFKLNTNHYINIISYYLFFDNSKLIRIIHHHFLTISQEKLENIDKNLFCPLLYLYTFLNTFRIKGDYHERTNAVISTRK